MHYISTSISALGLNSTVSLSSKTVNFSISRLTNRSSYSASWHDCHLKTCCHFIDSCFQILSGYLLILKGLLLITQPSDLHTNLCNWNSLTLTDNISQGSTYPKNSSSLVSQGNSKMGTSCPSITLGHEQAQKKNPWKIKGSNSIFFLALLRFPRVIW